MHKASAIVFYLARSEEFPGFTSNIEIGYWLDSPSIYVCIPEDSIKKGSNRYIEIKCRERGITVYRNIEDCYKAVVDDLNREGKIWFTSDTHFGQERTLKLSKRPFRNVRDMDLALISNWNKTVRMNDTVYHLGDFGESFNYLDCLNYKEFNFVKGNYEKDKMPEIMKDIEYRINVNIYDNDECIINTGDYKLYLRHEPISGRNLEIHTNMYYMDIFMEGSL